MRQIFAITHFRILKTAGHSFARNPLKAYPAGIFSAFMYILYLSKAKWSGHYNLLLYVPPGSRQAGRSGIGMIRWMIGKLHQDPLFMPAKLLADKKEDPARFAIIYPSKNPLAAVSVQYLNDQHISRTHRSPYHAERSLFTPDHLKRHSPASRVDRS